MTTVYQVLAIVVAIIHSMVALYLLSLPLMILKKNAPDWYFKILAGILGIAASFHFTSGVCPLTFAENYLRVQGGRPAYAGNFLNHYAETFFNFSIPSRLVSSTIIFLAFLFIVTVFNKVRLRQRIKTINPV